MFMMSSFSDFGLSVIPSKSMSSRSTSWLITSAALVSIACVTWLANLQEIGFCAFSRNHIERLLSGKIFAGNCMKIKEIGPRGCGGIPSSPIGCVTTQCEHVPKRKTFFGWIQIRNRAHQPSFPFLLLTCNNLCFTTLPLWKNAKCLQINQLGHHIYSDGTENLTCMIHSGICVKSLDFHAGKEFVTAHLQVNPKTLYKCLVSFNLINARIHHTCLAHGFS